MPASVAPSVGQRPRHGNWTRRIAPAAETYGLGGTPICRPVQARFIGPLGGVSDVIRCKGRALVWLEYSVSIASLSHIRAMSIRLLPVHGGPHPLAARDCWLVLPASHNPARTLQIPIPTTWVCLQSRFHSSRLNNAVHCTGFHCGLHRSS
jgi:hypothetical protein